MIPENLLPLISGLKAKTEKKQAIWTKTSRPDEYMLDLIRGAITIDSWVNEETNMHFLDFTVLNDKADMVDRVVFSQEEEPMEYKQLQELHVLARRAYYKVDETFKEILKEISEDGVIGGKDNLPF